jgi:glycosyltransferase involved in cell wall biosynthesis
MTRRVLHVLPHPGGGGETYVDALAAIEGYRFERAYLARGPDPCGARLAIFQNAVAVQRAAFSFDLLHVVGEVASTLCLPALAARPSVVSPQGLHLLRRLDGLGRRAATVNLQLVVRAATRTVCSSTSEHTELTSMIGRRAAGRTVVVRNGVTVPDPVPSDRRAALRDEFGIGASDAVGAWIATLDAHKDPLSPIHAVNRIRREGAEVTLLVAGDGPLRAEVEQAARVANAVRVLGFRRDIEHVLDASDFFVLSSRREGLSFSLLEAMAHGLAPVVSDAPANVEAVANAGVVVPYGDVARFAEAFERLARDPEERQALGGRARERVAQHFSVDEMLRRTRRVYEEILAGAADA